MVPVNSSHVELGHPMPRYRLSFNGILLYGFKIAYTPNPEKFKCFEAARANDFLPCPNPRPKQSPQRYRKLLVQVPIGYRTRKTPTGKLSFHNRCTSSIKRCCASITCLMISSGKFPFSRATITSLSKAPANSTRRRFKSC